MPEEQWDGSLDASSKEPKETLGNVQQLLICQMQEQMYALTASVTCLSADFLCECNKPDKTMLYCVCHFCVVVVLFLPLPSAFYVFNFGNN